MSVHTLAFVDLVNISDTYQYVNISDTYQNVNISYTYQNVNISDPATESENISYQSVVVNDSSATWSTVEDPLIWISLDICGLFLGCLCHHILFSFLKQFMNSRC